MSNIYNAWKYNNFYAHAHTCTISTVSTVYTHTHVCCVYAVGRGGGILRECRLHYMCAHIPGKQRMMLGEWEEEGVCLWVEFHSSDLLLFFTRKYSS